MFWNFAIRLRISGRIPRMVCPIHRMQSSLHVREVLSNVWICMWKCVEPSVKHSSAFFSSLFALNSRGNGHALVLYLCNVPSLLYWFMNIFISLSIHQSSPLLVQFFFFFGPLFSYPYIHFHNFQPLKHLNLSHFPYSITNTAYSFHILSVLC